MDEKTLRALVDAGGVKKVRVVALGGRFHIELVTHKGEVTASTIRGGVKTWTSLDSAVRWVRGFGFGTMMVDVSKWQSGQKTLSID